MRIGRRTTTILCTSALLFGTGAIETACTTGKTAAAGNRYIVTGGNAQFYKYGPAQSFGSDFVIPRGRKLTMVQRAFGYSRVTTDDGVTGYISTDDIALAPPEPPPPPATPVPRREPTSHVRKRSNVQGTPGEPLFDVNDVPMPLPGDPVRKSKPEPEPSFRY
jgi:hypothetical protein